MMPQQSFEHQAWLSAPHFLSPTNPLATVDQREMEETALKVLHTPAVQRAMQQAAQRFRILAGADVPAEAWLNFDAMMEEWAFHYVLIAVNFDANYPKVLHSNFAAPHEWFGMKVPGCRGPGCGDNADNNYAVVPIDGHAHFELHGRRSSFPTVDCPILLAGNISLTSNITSLDFRDMQIDEDGSFVVTIGPEPAAGRRNHLQSTIDSHFLVIRDARADWRQLPSAFEVHRLEPPTAPPMTIDEMAALAARFIVEDVGLNFANKQLVAHQEINTFSQPAASAAWGGIASQCIARGHLNLADDEAFVLDFDPGGAGYHVVTTNNFWFTTLDYWNNTSTLNRTQSAANADGTYTYVIAARDPGVHNWIDTTGLHETLIVIRIQLLPRNADGSYGGKPATKGKLVKLRDLDDVLPNDTRRVTPTERQQQIAARDAQFKARYLDH